MPLSKKRQAEYMREKRQGSQEGAQTEGSRVKGSQEMVRASYVMGLDGKMYEALQERTRYLKLSDNQVLDRLNQPEARVELPGIRACNESYNYRPNKSNKERVKAMVKEATR